MKAFQILLLACLVLTVSLFVGCTDKDFATPKQITTEKMGINGEKYDALLALYPEEARISQRSPITYLANFCGDVVWTGSHATTNSIDYPEYWDYYSFYANEGSTLDIYVKRLSCSMDPAFRLYPGIFTNTDDLGASYGFWDDEVSHPCCWSDPYLDNWDVPASGWYTLAVFDFLSCGAAPYPYELIISGNNSTIVVDCCDSGVENMVFDDGDTMMGMIMDCAAEAENHGEFVSCVAHLTNEWKKDGLITGYEKELIMACVGEANLP